jgi:tetratricopeptide (TPR) repeat protein
MPSKVNTKFLMFLVIAVCVAGVLIGGLYVLNVRGKAKRNIRLGDEAVAAADFRKARDYYGRAVHREPGNMQYLEKLEQVTLQVRPHTSEEARELYQGWVSLLHHGARHDARNPDRHLRLLHELHNTARLVRQQWDILITPGEDMWRGVPDSDPQRYLGKVYRSLAIFNRVKVSTEEEITGAEQDMREAIEHLPNHDLAWATMIQGQMALADKMREQGRSGAAVDHQLAQLREWSQKAQQAAPNGPETARMQVLALVLQRGVNADSVTLDEISAASARLEQTLLAQEVGSGLLGDSIELLAALDEDGAARGCEIVKAYLEKNPEALDKWLALATLSHLSNQIDQAQSAAQRVLEAEQLPVGLLSQLQPELRKRAAGILVDLEGRRLADADPSQWPERLKTMEEARARLAALVRDSDSDPQLLRADAKIAYTKGDYAKAALLYDRLVRETAFVDDVETLFFSAVSLERVNAVGRAHERVIRALQIRPGNATLLKFKARLEVAMGKRDDATATLNLLPKSEMASDDVRQLIAAIDSASPNILENPDADPVTAAIGRASQAMVRGELDSARTTLTGALAKAPENVPLLHALIALEIRAGNQDTARDYLARGQKIDPANVALLQWESILKYENPVEALRAFHVTAIQDERERALSMLTGLKVIGWQQEVVAKRARQEGNTDLADKAHAYAEQARAELDEWATRAEHLAPDEPRVLEHWLDEAVAKRDWTRAEQLLSRARSSNADQVDGKFFQGRLEIARAAALVQDGKSSEARPVFLEAVRHLEAVTERLGFHANAWKSLAIAHASLGNYTQAERAYEQAYKCNPNDLDGVRAYVEMLLRRGDQTRALRLLRDAHALAPEDQLVRHLWLKLEAEVGDRPLALRARRKLAKDKPQDFGNVAELVQLLSTTQPDRTTILDGAGNPVFPEARWARLNGTERAKAVADAQSEWHKESDALLAKMKERLGGDLQFAVLQANTLRNRGDVAGGELVMEQFIADQGANGPTLASLLELGRYQVRATHFNDAVTTFTKAIAVQDSKIRQADQELAQLYMQLTMYEKAVQHLDAIIAVFPERQFRNQRVECLIKLKRFDEADSRLQEITREHGEDFIAMLLSASLAEARGDELVSKGDSSGAERHFTAQRDLLNRAQAFEPLSIMPRMILAQSLVKEYRRTQRSTALNDALHVLEDAEKARAGTLEVGMLRVAVMNEMGDASAALNELQRLVAKYPENHVTRRDLVDLLIQRRETDQAIAVVDEAIRINPTISRWHELLGDLQLAARGDAPAAVAAYTRAYELSATPAGLVKLTEAVLASPDPNCSAIVDRYVARTPAELDANPLLREGYARALNCAGRRDEAIEELRKAYALRKQLISEKKMAPQEISFWFQAIVKIFASTAQPGVVDSSAAEQLVLEVCGGAPNLQELRGLARLWVNSGDGTLARTIEYQLQAVKVVQSAEKQTQIESYHELASYYYASGQFKEAAAAYESLLQLEPERVEALNNLAYITAVWFKDPQKAIPYAERAVQLAPKQHAVVDTLGWSYYLAGNLEKAREWLQESLRILPSAPTYAHMAAVMLDSGDLKASRLMLDEAARLNPDLETRKELDRVDKDLKQAQQKQR